MKRQTKITRVDEGDEKIRPLIVLYMKKIENQKSSM
jgi:hypothetical protein